MKSVWGETYEGCCQEVRIYDKNMQLKSVISDAEVRGSRDSASLTGVGAFTRTKKRKQYHEKT
jgi:hypothetical protein